MLIKTLSPNYLTGQDPISSTSSTIKIILGKSTIAEKCIDFSVKNNNKQKKTRNL